VQIPSHSGPGVDVLDCIVYDNKRDEQGNSMLTATRCASTSFRISMQRASWPNLSISLCIISLATHSAFQVPFPSSSPGPTPTRKRRIICLVYLTQRYWHTTTWQPEFLGEQQRTDSASVPRRMLLVLAARVGRTGTGSLSTHPRPRRLRHRAQVFYFLIWAIRAG